MINIKGMAMANDGSMKRIAITYDDINDEGKVINPNVRINRVVTDENVLAAVDIIESYAQTIIESE